MNLSKSSNVVQPPFASGLPLSTLLSQLGDEVVVSLNTSAAPVALVGVTYYDSDVTQQHLTGQLLLLTAHAELTVERINELCAELKQHQVSGVVARDSGSGVSPALVAACQSNSLHLLALTANVGWREFDALISRLLGEHGAGLQLGSNSGDRLFALANSVAQAFRGSVAIEDHRRNILAYSALPGQAIDQLRASGILTRKTPDGPLNEVRYRQVFSTEEVSRFPTEYEFAPRAAMPIRAGNIPLGSIWVIDPTGDDLATPLAQEKEDALRSAANIAASYIVDAWRFDHGDERSKEAALRRVLTGTQHVNDFTVLGIRSDRQYLVAAIDGTSATEGDVSEIRAAASRHLSVYFPGSTCAVVDGRVLAVVPALSRENVTRSLERLLPELERLTGVHCHCGVSDPSHPGSFAEDTERAIRIADCARDLGLTVAGADAVQAQLVLRACNDALQGADLRLPETEQLLADAEAETRATLLAWLEERGNAPRIAERLNLHEQTVRYRVRKATSRLGIDLDDPDRTLALWLQLRLAELG